MYRLCEASLFSYMDAGLLFVPGHQFERTGEQYRATEHIAQGNPEHVLGDQTGCGELRTQVTCQCEGTHIGDAVLKTGDDKGHDHQDHDDQFAALALETGTGPDGQTDQEVTEDSAQNKLRDIQGKFAGDDRLVVGGHQIAGGSAEIEDGRQDKGTDEVADIADDPDLDQIHPGAFFAVDTQCHSHVIAGKQITADKDDQDDRDREQCAAEYFAGLRIFGIQDGTCHIGEQDCHYDKETGHNRTHKKSQRPFLQDLRFICGCGTNLFHVSC